MAWPLATANSAVRMTGVVWVIAHPRLTVFPYIFYHCNSANLLFIVVWILQGRWMSMCASEFVF